MQVIITIIVGIMFTIVMPTLVSKHPPISTNAFDVDAVVLAPGVPPISMEQVTAPVTISLAMPEDNFSILSNYAYSEVLPLVKPADTIKAALLVPEGSPRQEIRLVSAALGLNVGLMNAFAQIESDFNPQERTGSYIGLYQLSRQEFDRYGPTRGNILNARDNSIAAAIKIEYEAALFKISTRHIPSNSDLYLIHQQGMQGAAEHLAGPERPAWKSMCATNEGHQKGVRWCKKAIWGNTLPAFKSIWKSVEDFTSGAFVQMWADRVTALLERIVPPVRAAGVAEVKVHRHQRHLTHHHLRHYAKGTD